MGSTVMVNAESPSKTAYVVVQPRDSDAIGVALRGAYGDRPLPDDMAKLLQRIDAGTAGRWH